ncbi:hypothetical protein EYZ11_004133 [Aspergillus tanneri]|uniref:Major facilitator superfamily (MFS) profile domain-containing protein n=1 Tax=Aspergillus tanneri TaxID=1220188 RepID=A0A4S3JLC0_9EURO|nr:uncharacterized protein ATNIH1004_001000 [Aspergillus tanneri]KAA8652096.1 hypothetical protein ATNIH1004_001000 [Aspergillus tanneri]THC96399.1 hypothetical protein EYZ11_004133 [Aspergillus tanneri]
MEMQEVKPHGLDGIPNTSVAAAEGQSSSVTGDSMNTTDGSNGDNQVVELSNWKFFTVLVSVCAASFLAGYDGTCVGTLGPIISDEFNSLNDVSWYGIAYSLASSATVLSYGKLYLFYPAGTVFALSLGTFVVGSILCAAAPSSIAFIIGRAIAGLGNAGILSGCNIIFVRITPLHRRPFYQALTGGVECIALATAPLIAGAITAYTSWRICFYISIPLGVIPIMTVLTFLQLPKTAEQSATTSTLARLHQLDLLGMALFLPLVICLVLALQWGGSEYAWNSRHVVPLLVVAGVLAVVFVVQQYYMGDQGTIPHRLLRSRVLDFSIVVIFATAGALYVFTYYLPLYYQAVREVSTMQSGLRDLSRILGLVVAIIFGGILVTRIGYYMPFMVAGGTLMSIGAGLTTTFDQTTSLGYIIGYQAIFGLGCGLTFQQPYTAVQAAVAGPDVTSAIVIITFAQFLGSVVMLSISQNIFLNHLASGLAAVVPGLDPTQLLESGAMNLKNLVPADQLPRALGAYNDALVQVFYAGLGTACATVVAALGSGWKTVRHTSPQDKQK